MVRNTQEAGTTAPDLRGMENYWKAKARGQILMSLQMPGSPTSSSADDFPVLKTERNSSQTLMDY